MHQSHKALDLLDDLLKKFLMLRSQGRASLIHLVKAHVLFDGLCLLLYIRLKDISEEVFQLDDWVVIHGAQVGS